MMFYDDRPKCRACGEEDMALRMFHTCTSVDFHLCRSCLEGIMEDAAKWICRMDGIEARKAKEPLAESDKRLLWEAIKGHGVVNSRMDGISRRCNGLEKKLSALTETVDTLHKIVHGIPRDSATTIICGGGPPPEGEEI